MAVGGPLDGEAVDVPSGATEVHIPFPEDRLEVLLVTTIQILQRGMAVVPHRMAIYRVERDGGGQLVELERYRILRFVGWEDEADDAQQAD